MAYVILGKNKQVILKFKTSVPSEWTLESRGFILDNYSEVYASVQAAIHPHSVFNVDRRRPEDYFEDLDAQFEYETLNTKAYQVYAHYKTGEIIDTSILGHLKAPTYAQVSHAQHACDEARPWFHTQVKRVAGIEKTNVKIPFFLSPKRTRFNDTSIVAEETKYTTHESSMCGSGPGSEPVVAETIEGLFAEVETKNGGSELARLAGFKITI